MGETGKGIAFDDRLHGPGVSPLLLLAHLEPRGLLVAGPTPGLLEGEAQVERVTTRLVEGVEHRVTLPFRQRPTHARQP